MNTVGKTDHIPRITLELPRILGCTCGWRTPADARDSDTAYAEHLAITRMAEGASR